MSAYSLWLYQYGDQAYGYLLKHTYDTYSH